MSRSWTISVLQSVYLFARHQHRAPRTFTDLLYVMRANPSIQGMGGKLEFTTG